MADDAPPDRGDLPMLIGYNLGHARNAMWRDMVRSTDGDVRSGQFTALVVIGRNPGISQNALARELGLDKATIVALIDRLEKKSLVARRVSPTDRRYRELHLTDTGKVEEARLMAARRTHETRFRALFSDDELALLFDMLGRIQAADGQ